MRIRRYLSTILVAAAVVSIAASAGRAEDGYPSRAIRLIAPFPPGSPPDVVARKVAETLSVRLKIPVVVENKPGAGGSIGASEVARSQPDGYTYLVAIADAMVSTPATTKVAYDVLRDFTLIGKIAANGPALVIHPSHNIATLRELIDLAKQSKSPPTFASFGQGSFPQLVMTALARQSGAAFAEIPYRGSTPAMQDLLGNQIAMVFTSPSMAETLVAEGKVKALAVIGSKRSPNLPKVPTFAEAGFDGFFARNVSWIGLVGPAKLPAAIVEKIGEAMRTSLQDPAVAKWFADVGFDVLSGTSVDFENELKAELQTVTNFIRNDLGIQPQ